jgi:hypothetical protein
MTRWIGATIVASVLAFAVPASAKDAAGVFVRPPAQNPSTVTSTDVSAQRNHRRYHRHYGYRPYYYARPDYYRPYSYSSPAPFTFGFGFGPWW